MIRRPKPIVAVVLVTALAGLVAVAPFARAEEPAKGIALSGSVKKAQAVDAAALAALPRRATLAKVPGADATVGRSRWKGSRSGPLDKAEIAKATNDNFDRPLDLAVVVTGRDGKKALFSWGELFLADDAVRPSSPTGSAPSSRITTTLSRTCVSLPAHGSEPRRERSSTSPAAPRATTAESSGRSMSRAASASSRLAMPPVAASSRTSCRSKCGRPASRLRRGRRRRISPTRGSRHRRSSFRAGRRSF
ncbi:MAG: hypothetical protein IPP07_30805 [Holophagales bacterium]|nr:hypothetical protein [Holophagales bacterium]